MQLANLIQCVLALLPDDIRHPTTTSSTANFDKNDCSSSSTQRQSSSTRTFRIVDFGGGTGHLAVPLALLLPHCDVVCVDLKKWSLDLLHRRVDGSLADSTNGNNGSTTSTQQHQKQHNNSHKLPLQSTQIQTSGVLPNLSTYHGSIQTYPHNFDIGVSLHACGEASDWVLRKCLESEANFIVCSCCCGKLRREAGNPYVFQSTGGNEKEIHYPQSKVFASLGGWDEHKALGDLNKADDNNLPLVNNCSNSQRSRMTSEMFDEIAKAADYSELGDVRKPRNACRRAAKSLVEWDRLLFAKETIACNEGVDTHESNVVLTRMVPWEASPKNDILIGWSQERCNPYRHGNAGCASGVKLTRMPEEDATCDVDFQVALHHLFGQDVPTHSRGSMNDMTDLAHECNDQNDWTAQEEADITSQIKTFLLRLDGVMDDKEMCNGNDKSNILKFPTGMGPRKRKLIHYVAENMGLRHWGEGKKDSEKIVVVALRKK